MGVEGCGLAPSHLLGRKLLADRYFLLKVLANTTETTHSLLVLTCVDHCCVFSGKKMQTEPQAAQFHTWPTATQLTLWIASHLSTPAWCSGELVSSAHPLGHSLLFALPKEEVSAVQGLMMLN